MVFLGVLFTCEPLTTDVTRVRLRLDVCASVHVQTSTLSELLAAGVTGEWTVPGVRPLVGRKVTSA